GKGEHVEGGRVADAVRSTQVSSERRLAVGPHRDEVEPAARGEQAGTEADHDVPALVSEGHRRHRDEDVVGQQGHQRVEVGRLPRAGELGHERVLGGGAGGGGGRGAGRRRRPPGEAGGGGVWGGAGGFGGGNRPVSRLAGAGVQG